MIKYQRQPAIYVIPGLMKQKLDSIPTVHCYNVIKSPLPKHSIELNIYWAIFSQDHTTELTIIQLKQDYCHSARNKFVDTTVV